MPKEGNKGLYKIKKFATEKWHSCITDNQWIFPHKQFWRYRWNKKQRNLYGFVSSPEQLTVSCLSATPLE
jgi:hypothetical protein